MSEGADDTITVSFLIETNFHYNLSSYVIDYQRDEFGFRDRESKFSDIDILIYY